MDNPFQNSNQNNSLIKSKRSSNKKQLFIIGLAIVLVLAATLTLVFRDKLWGSSGTAVNNDVPQTNALMQQYQEQLPMLAEKVQANNEDKQAKRDYAVALYATGDIEKAKEQYLEELKLNATDPIIYNNLGNIYRDLGDYETAVVNYKKAIELNPQMANAYANLANVYTYSLSKPDLGIETYKSALIANPGDTDINLLLANAYEQMGNKASAKAVFESILVKAPDNLAAKQGLERLAK